MREVLSEPRFQDDKIALRKQQMLQSMKERNDDTRPIEGRELNFLAFGEKFWANQYSTAASVEHVRRAKAAGLPVTCDVTPHHLTLTDAWLAGARRWAWEALDADGRVRDPWRDGALVAFAGHERHFRRRRDRIFRHRR